MHELLTPRLRLRRWRDDDLGSFAAMSADPEVMQYLMGLLSRELCVRVIARIDEHFAASHFGLWAIERKADAAFLGLAGLQHVNFEAPFTPAVEVGWRLRRDAWGQGYAFEAAAAAIDDGFARIHLDRIVAFTVPANQRSQALMQRLGMQRDPDHDFAHPRLPGNHPLSGHWLFRLSRVNWRGVGTTMRGGCE